MMRPRGVGGVLRGFLGVALPLLVACKTGYIDIYNCPDPCYNCDDPCDPCPEGDCVPLPELGWEGPLLLWMGPELEVPECPDGASAEVYNGHQGLRAEEYVCPGCACERPTCQLPEGVTASDHPDCPNDGPGTALTDFLAPDGWTGACAAPSPIPDPAANSLLFHRPTMSDCTPVPLPEPLDSAHIWVDRARACRPVEPAVECKERGRSCAPRVGGFRHCVYKVGVELLCPEGYPERELTYQSVEGSFTCTECECGPPEGGECRARVEVHADDACNSMLAGRDVSHADAEEWCDPGLPAGDLRGLLTTWVVNEPGECTPVPGQPIGELEPADASTFCCQTAR